MNNVKIAAALRSLAEAFETPSESPPVQPAALPAPRGRGRPAKGEAAPPAAPAQDAAAPESSPFDTPAAPAQDAAAPAATLEEVRTALTALKDASSQEIAVSLLKDAGKAGNLTQLLPANYGAVVAGVKAKLDGLLKKPVVADDPFEMPTNVTPTKPVTLEDVKKALVDAQKTTSTDAVQRVVMSFGGKAVNPDTGAEGPSLKALPPDKWAVTIEAIKKLPATK